MLEYYKNNISLVIYNIRNMQYEKMNDLIMLRGTGLVIMQIQVSRYFMKTDKIIFIVVNGILVIIINWIFFIWVKDKTSLRTSWTT